MLKNIGIIALSLILSIILIPFIIGRVRSYKRVRKNEKRRLVILIIIGLLLLAINVKTFGYSVLNISKCLSSKEKKEPQDVGAEDDPLVIKPASENVTPTSENHCEPIGPVRSVEVLFPRYFHLSNVDDSKMLKLFEIISPDGTSSASNLKPCSEKLSNYLDQCSNPQQFYSFYTGLKSLFPDGMKVFSFCDVSTYLECLDQIRGAGATLERYWQSSNAEKISNTCHHLEIRARDALFFGKTEGISSQMAWVLGEIAFASLINEAVFGDLTGSDLSDWYYRVAQIFECMGDIADSETLQLHLYYVSAVCYFSAYEQISICGLSKASGSYGSNIWNAYFNMVYRVAVRNDSVLRTDFFKVILNGEHDVLDADLPNNVTQKTLAKLKDLKSYWHWRESPEGKEIEEQLIEYKEAGLENG